MEELKILAQYVTDNRRRPYTEKAKRYELAQEFLRDSHKLTDEELGKLLQMKPGEARFRMFKSRLRKKLLHAMLGVALPDKYQTPYNDAIVQCVILQYSVRFLLLVGKRSVTVSLAKEGLEKAQTFSLTEFVIFFSRVLRTNASIHGDEHLFDEYRKICSTAIETFHAEDEANALSEALTRAHIRSAIYSKELIRTGDNYCKRVNQLRNTYDSFNLNLSYFRLNGQMNFIKQDYQSALTNWVAFENYLNSFTQFDNWGRKVEAMLQQLKCWVYLRQYDHGEKVAKQLAKEIRPTSPSWLTFKELEFLLFMHSNRFVKAKEIYREIQKSQEAASLTEVEAERWEIFGVYITFLDTFLEIEGQAIRHTNRNKIKDLLSNLPEQAKDKQGYNVSILIIQVLWRMAEGDFPAAMDRISALNTYAYRYLKGDEYSRSYLFIKMLTALEKANFDFKKAAKVINPLHQELTRLSEGSSGKLIDGMEVIPYPHLWEIVKKITE